MSFVLTDSVFADKISPDLIFLTMQGIPVCVNSYVKKYLPITVENKTQKDLPFNHVIKCGTKFFWSDLKAAATTTRSRKARIESHTSWGQSSDFEYSEFLTSYLKAS